MKKGIGIAVAIGVISLAGSFFVLHQSDDEANKRINPQLAEQYRGANEMLMMQLNGALNSFNNRNNRMPVKAEELIPDFLQDIPRECFSRLSSTVSAYDGKGGWVYDGISFRPNTEQKANVE